MRAKTLINIIHRFFYPVILALVLAACGGGSGGSSGGGATLAGTAATGAAVDGIVYVTGSNGVEVNTAVNADGTFSVPVAGLTEPYILRVVPNGAGEVLYSFASAANTTVNITPLTTLALYLTYDDDLSALYDAWSASFNALNDASIEDAQEIINANLAALFGNNNVDASYYDFMNVAFSADGTSIDGALDALDINIDFVNDMFTVDIDGTPFTWNPAISTSGINLGDFPVSENSTWQLSVTDSANNIDQTEIVTGIFVPNDPAEFEEASEGELSGEFAFQGLQISFNLSNVTYNVTGTGDIGTLISGTIQGTVRITGSYNGQPVDDTVTLNTLFAWERLS